MEIFNFPMEDQSQKENMTHEGFYLDNNFSNQLNFFTCDHKKLYIDCKHKIKEGTILIKKKMLKKINFFVNNWLRQKKKNTRKNY